MSGPIRVADAPPAGDVAPTVEAFLRQLGGPTLLRTKGRGAGPPRALATLVHGNEPSGVRAVHAWLASGELPAVDTDLLVLSVEAALEPPGFAHRERPGGRDLNRCFRPPFEGRDGELAEHALELLQGVAHEALVDLHNTTGHTPPYGVGPAADPAHLHIVSLFGDRFVQSDLKLGALVEATDPGFPSVTVECGRAGDPAADAVAREGLWRYLHAESLAPPAPPGDPPVAVLCDPVRVSIGAGARVAYGDAPVSGVDLTVRADVDRHNFEMLASDAPLGWLRASDAWPLEARGADGRDVSRELFAARDGVLRARRPLVPMMMTTDPRIAESDCLFYVVRERAHPVRATSGASDSVA